MEKQNQSKFIVVEFSPNGYIYKTFPNIYSGNITVEGVKSL